MSPNGLAERVSGSTVGFWAGYLGSLKSRIVEEPIDVWFHRPPAYLLARFFLPTRVSPNAITVVSMLLGVASGVCFVAPFRWHLQVGALALVLSAIFDCTDGQLARMRGTASPFGRMLDGSADLVVTIAFVSGTAFVVLAHHWQPPLLRYAAIAAILVASVTSSFHTTMYDHFKNVFLKMTTPTYRDAEDVDTATRRFKESSMGALPGPVRITWPIYLFYVKSQEDYMRKFDPFTAPKLSQLPPYDEARARIYARHAEPVLAVFRTWFGPGSLAFGIAVSAAFDVFDWYLLYRLLVLNAVFYGYVRPAQRRASREAFREMHWEFDRAA